MTRIFSNLQLHQFKKDERGLALTEYLILLGLLTAVVVAAVLVFGGTLATGWGTWGQWLGILQPADAITTAGG